MVEDMTGTEVRGQGRKAIEGDERRKFIKKMKTHKTLNIFIKH